MDLHEKFFSNVEKTEVCWNWVGRMHHGVPTLGTQSARRVSLLLVGKEMPTDKRVMPWCKNKRCVHPDHLVVGSEARFWSKVGKLGDDDCWVWMGSFNKEMYGRFNPTPKVQVRAHIYSWELYTGRPVRKGILVCHTCDHPWCVNPHHLFLGTNADNMKDKISKGRQTSKLNADQVRGIRADFAQGMSYNDMSVKYGMRRTAIYNVCNGISWKHLT